jgi:hypothetical protein
MHEHDNKKKMDKLVQHAEVFADFWLGMVGAGARGLAEALGKPEPVNATPHKLEDRIEHTVDRAAKGLRAAFEEAKRTAEQTEKDLRHIHGHHHGHHHAASTNGADVVDDKPAKGRGTRKAGRRADKGSAG